MRKVLRLAAKNYEFTWNLIIDIKSNFENTSLNKVFIDTPLHLFNKSFLNRKNYQSCSKIQIPKITQDAKITVSLQLCCWKVRPTEIRLIYNYGQKYIIDKNASKYLPKFSPTRAKNISILKRNAYSDWQVLQESCCERKK